MNKLIMISLGFLITIMISCNNVNEWENVQKTGTIDAYQKFIINNPGNENLSSAHQMIDSLDNVLWENTKNENIAEAYEKYIEENQNGKYIDEAKKIIKDLAEKAQEIDDWKDVLEFNVLGDFKEFIEKYPESIYINEAEKRIFLIKKPVYKTELVNIVDFFEALSKNDYDKLTEFYADTVILEAIGNDYERVDTITKPLNKKILDNFGYWNVGGDLIYKTFLNGTYFLDGDNICKIDMTDDELKINFGYWDNGAAGSFSLHWKKQKGEWKIDHSSIYLPNFM